MQPKYKLLTQQQEMQILWKESWIFSIILLNPRTLTCHLHKEKHGYLPWEYIVATKSLFPSAT